MNLSQKKILFILGTRPEAIKLAPLILWMEANFPDLAVVTCSTGQHEALVSEALGQFGLQTDVQLSVMRQGQSLSELSRQLHESLPTVFDQVHPDLVVVHGDTTTAYIAAVTSFYCGVPVAHVEAGLRTGSLDAPFPEEFNRRAISLIAALNFAPTEVSRDNLLGEGIVDEKIFVVGNTVVDAVRLIMGADRKRETEARFRPLYPDAKGPVLLRRGKFVLITLHRRENQGQPVLDVASALIDLATEFPDIDFVLPVHHNPAVRGPLLGVLGDTRNIVLIDPQPYPSFVWLIDSARVVLTDSGGVQEEAVSLGRKVLVLRESSERPEGIALGLIEVIGTDDNSVKEAVRSQLIAEFVAEKRLEDSPYGDGFAAQRIGNFIWRYVSV